MDHFIRAIRMCSGGETVTDGQAETACSYCAAGRCLQLAACEPESFNVQVARHALAQAELREAFDLEEVNPVQVLRNLGAV